MLAPALIALVFGYSPLITDALPMRPGGISLLTTTANIGKGGESVIVHVYVVPKDRVYRQKGEAKRPLNAEDLANGSQIDRSPHYLDLFQEKDGKLTRLNSVRFDEEGAVPRLEVRWLRHKEKQGPVILLRFFYVCDVAGWVIVTFHSGLQGRPTVQGIGFGGGRDESYSVTFDRDDRRGYMMVTEDCTIGDRRFKRFYRWSGRSFRGLPIDPK